MSLIADRLDLIEELAQHPALTEDEASMLPPAYSNAERLRHPATMPEQIDTAAAFDEIGFRLERLKRSQDDSNVEVFNPRRMKVKGPRLAQLRALG